MSLNPLGEDDFDFFPHLGLNKLSGLEKDLTQQLKKGIYHFQHDRIKEAAYSLIEENQKKWEIQK